ncbi:phosphoenolpyruvate-dependent sugar PTS family porter, EIIA 2 [Haemophilus sputorum HK 2154]|uniref:PTS sugar transporter subunit IIA n=1 Tax=Haemophilus sputorum TaxID=1078480 RepID=UPI00027A65E9|nr:PTS sugar transporter subunit IIA [Haemophilus sputorum]EJP30800.1 phosphoenolpyruvate-dependent sugar PTS family porter, EIIA 2 [Haemophilus sputorum HK 2154]
MLLTEFLTAENIHLDTPASCKKRALEIAGKLLADAMRKQLSEEIDSDEACPIACFDALLKREKLGCTALNNGVAMPHAKLANACTQSLEKPIAVFLKLEQPVDYEAQDRKEVDLIYAILFPEQSCHHYKAYLPKIAEKLSDKNIIKQIRTAETEEDIWQLFCYLDNQEEQAEKAEKTEEQANEKTE